MGDPVARDPLPQGTVEDRLDSWKEIAAYLRRDVTTAQRWEKREGMPVHRHLHDKLGSVYAFRFELDAWARSRKADLAAAGVESDSPPPSSELSAVAVIPQGSQQEMRGDTESRPAASTRFRRMWPLIVLAVVVPLVVVVVWVRQYTEYFWRNPVADARFERVTDFDGIEQAAAISRDGRFVAFQSDRDGQMDIWVSQLGTGRFYNLTRGRVRELVNPSVRALGFSPDGSLVTFWARQTASAGVAKIGVWAIPVLGGDPRPYLDGIAELDWSRDGSRLVYHTPAAGDPTSIRESGPNAKDQPIFTAAAGRHAHFPIWSIDQTFIYFVQGELPSAMDIWRIRASGGPPERITHHNTQVAYPVMVDASTLFYLATDGDGGGPWLFSIDVNKRVPHRVSTGLDAYTSLAASADGRRLVVTLASPKATLWRAALTDLSAGGAFGTPITLATGRPSSPRLGPDYLLFVSSSNGADSIWRTRDGTTSELWSAGDTRIIGGPELDPDGRRVAFLTEQRGKTSLSVMNADGSDAHVLASLQMRGSPAWRPDGQSLTSAAIVNGMPQLLHISLDGRESSFIKDYSVDPVWSPDGRSVVYSGPDIGTTFSLKTVSSDGRPISMPNLVLTRGARRVRFLAQQPRQLVVMRGDIEHKDLWLVDLDTASEHQLTKLPADFNVREFDISRDGREVVLERSQQQSDVLLIETQ